MEQSSNRLDPPSITPVEAPADDTAAAPEASAGRGFKQRVAEMSPHLSRYAEFSAACACSSVCPACIGAATASIVVPIVLGEHGQKRD